MPSVLHPATALLPVFILFLFLRAWIHKTENTYLAGGWMVLLLFVYAASFLLLSRFFKQGPRNTITDILAEFRHKGDLIT